MPSYWTAVRRGRRWWKGVGHLVEVRKGMAYGKSNPSERGTHRVKFEEVQSGHQFDIRADVANGPASAEIVRENMKRFPACDLSRRFEGVSPPAGDSTKCTRA